MKGDEDEGSGVGSSAGRRVNESTKERDKDKVMGKRGDKKILFWNIAGMGGKDR